MATAEIVVPCFDEADRLERRRFVRFAAAHPDVDFLFVDDGSTDATGAVLEELAGRWPGRLRVLRLAENRGKAEAVRRGVLDAFARGPAYVGYWDADLATPLEEIPRFLEVLEARPGVEVLLGSRVKLLGHFVDRKPLRHLAGRVFASLAARTLGLDLYDTQCGAKLLRTTPEVRRAFEQPFCTGWTFDVELLARLESARRTSGRPDPGATLREEPVRTWRDVRGSKVRPWHFLVALRELRRIHRRYPAARGLEPLASTPEPDPDAADADPEPRALPEPPSVRNPGTGL